VKERKPLDRIGCAKEEDDALIDEAYPCATTDDVFHGDNIIHVTLQKKQRAMYSMVKRAVRAVRVRKYGNRQPGMEES
jgi:hypothetical protein